MKTPFARLILPVLIAVSALLPSPARAQSESVESPEMLLFREADDAIRRGDQEWALDHLQIFVQTYPNSPLIARVHFERGLIFTQEGRLEQAIAAFEASVDKAANLEVSADARLRVAALYANAGRYGDIPRVLDPLVPVPLPEESRAELSRLMIRAYDGTERRDDAHREGLKLWQVLKPGSERTELELTLMDFVREIDDEAKVEADLKVAHLPSFYESALLERLLELKVQSKNLAGSLDTIDRYLARFPGDARARLMETRRRDLQLASQIDPKAIGVLLPLSAKGPLGAFAQNARKAIEIAVKHSSRKSGVDSVRVIVKDTEGKPETAVKALNELATSEKVVAVIGPIGTSEVKAAAARASEIGLPMLSLSPAEGLPGQGNFVFRMLPTASEQVSALVNYARVRMGLKNFAIIYPETPLGQQLFSHYISDVERLGGRVVGAEHYDANMADFKGPLFRLAGLYWPDARRYETQRNKTVNGWQSYSPKRLEDLERYWIAASDKGDDVKPRTRSDQPPIIDFDALFIAGLASKVGLILPQLTFRDVRGTQLLGFSEWNDPELFARAGGQADGALIVDGFNPGIDDPRAGEFVKDFTVPVAIKTPPPPASPGAFVPSVAPEERPPAMFEARAYDAVSMIADASQRLGIPSRTGLALRLSSSKGYAGLGGQIRFYRDGRTELPLILLEARGKEFVPAAR